MVKSRPEKVTAREIIADPARVRARARFKVDNTLLDDPTGRRFIRVKSVGERVVVWDEIGPRDGYVPVERTSSRRGFIEEFEGVAFSDFGSMDEEEWGLISNRCLALAERAAWRRFAEVPSTIAGVAR